MTDPIARVALVVGGASGIGCASAHALARTGVHVAIADISADAAMRAAAQLGGGQHRSYALDVCSEAEVQSTFDRVESDLGPICILANLAGIGGFVHGARPSLCETTLENWSNVMSVNSTGVFLCVREMLRRRAKRSVEHGRIINITSMAAQGGGINSPPAYIASKGAVLSLTKAAAGEAAPMGITVNCVAPGAIDTPMLRAVMPRERDAAYSQRVPLARIGTPEEVAAVVCFLASAAASYVTGACFDINGGMRMS